MRRPGGPGIFLPSIVLVLAGAFSAFGCASNGKGDSGGGSSDNGDDPGPNGFRLASSAFSDKGTIPVKYPRDGANISPPLS
jgi:hypothetical protein